MPKIPQDLNYHYFGDQKQMLGVSNFWNVMTNLPFLIVGLMGIRRVMANRLGGGMPQLRPAYLIFFIGVFLVGLGSGYYHLDPDNGTLIWDRLPMTIAFMALFSAIVGEYLSITWGRRLLYPLVLIGMASVVYWHWSEQQGHGDLRFYALVQFLPMFLIPVMLVFCQPRLSGNGYLWGIIGIYAAAKLAETGDVVIYEHLRFLSGHSLKHLLAAGGAALFLVALQKRVPVHQAIKPESGAVSE
ncbi:ceramidase domain-containing protein [Methylobacter luteus]|uniref:ceramidase domain-containing protein n=1 Tax=Methylobacter luteus TaxID=415 RepID=UPI000407FB11|nr:ceramidase domain-containing protein [Methylobacter luteus]